MATTLLSFVLGMAFVILLVATWIAARLAGWKARKEYDVKKVRSYRRGVREQSMHHRRLSVTDPSHVPSIDHSSRVIDSSTNGAIYTE
ncbi:MAG: hypothetical protein AAGB26_03680 [Planctomycetota bacterium]